MTGRVLLTGADLVLPDRIATGLTLVVEGGRIADLVSGPREVGEGETRVHLPGCVIVPGFVDVHVHGACGADVLTGADALAKVAASLPAFGVTAFCPTSIACEPSQLAAFLSSVGSARQMVVPGARVLPAHLESNFINPDFCGAQPASCLRSPASALIPGMDSGNGFPESIPGVAWTGADILEIIEARAPDVGIVTMAPELDEGLSLVRRLAAQGIRVSLGHSGATFEQAQAAVNAGARHATHLFNRMPPMTHREPGLAGAVLASEDIAAEVVCDGHHVHPAFVRLAIRAKGRNRTMAITDGTAGSGLPAGSRTTLGDRPITVREVARLDDGTIAGSVATMDRVLAWLVGVCGLNLREAAELCATTPARELGLVNHGVIARGAVADLTVLSRNLAVLQTWIGGALAWSGTSAPLEPSPST